MCAFHFTYLTCDPFRVPDGQAPCNGEALEGDQCVVFAPFSPTIRKSIDPIFRRFSECDRVLCLRDMEQLPATAILAQRFSTT